MSRKPKKPKPPKVKKQRIKWSEWLDPKNPNEITYQDDHVSLKRPFGWGMQQLFKINFSAVLDAEALEHQDPAKTQQQMERYFRDPIVIFQPPGEDTALPNLTWADEARNYASGFLTLTIVIVAVFFSFMAWSLHVPWLIPVIGLVAVTIIATLSTAWAVVRGFKTERLWPGLMEERLSAMIAARFEGVEADIRAVIGKFTDLFLDNNWLYTRIKRALQIFAIICFYVAVIPALVICQINIAWFADPVVSVLCAVWLLFMFGLGFGVFYVMNQEVFQDKYYQTLQNSAQVVSTMLITRMQSIYRMFQHSYNHVEQIQFSGEPLEDNRDIASVHDRDLEGYNAFFDTQIMIWLAKRLEYIEWFLMYRMQSAQTLHAVIARAAFIATICIAIIGVVPIVGFVVFFMSAISITTLEASTTSIASAAIKTAIVLLILVPTIWVSWRSYAKDQWNSGKRILYEHFKSNNLEGWETFRELEFDRAIAGRVQRAMARIRYYAERAGFGQNNQQQSTPPRRHGRHDPHGDENPS